jgi:hypothetical protein
MFNNSNTNQLGNQNTYNTAAPWNNQMVSSVPQQAFNPYSNVLQASQQRISETEVGSILFSLEDLLSNQLSRINRVLVQSRDSSKN